MGVRIRKSGKIVCAAITFAEEGDCYINDGLLYELSVRRKILVTTENDYHIKNRGEWWWKGQEPNDVVIDEFYYT